MNLKLFLLGLLLLFTPIFRQDFFVRHETFFPLYFLLFPVGLVTLLWSLSHRHLGRFTRLLIICIMIEGIMVGSVAYMACFQRYTPFPDIYYYWVRGQYSSFKNTTNFNATLSRYDSSLAYRFKSGIIGRFTNPEFDVEVRTNSLGVRDDEASLHYPQVVVLGDSHAMGWGVEKKERFTSVIGSKLQVKVLNTAITSYGTHREAKLLREVNLDSCSVLIIQYCENDLQENKANFPIAQKPGIDALGFRVAVNQNTIIKTYFPFKGLFIGLRWLIAAALVSAQTTVEAAPRNRATAVIVNEHAKAFFPYLKQIRQRYQGPIVVFDLGIYNYPLVKEFQAYQATHPVKDVYLLNVHPLLSRQDYFTIDDHINAQGHARIGHAVADFIASKGWLTGMKSANILPHK